MSKIVEDQADGLRRLLAGARTRVIAVAGMSGAAGVTTAVMNLGAALVQQGRQVLLLDEHCPTADSACAVWAVDPSGTLADALGASPAAQLPAARAACGVAVLPAPPGALPADADPRLLCRGGVILVDAALDGAGRLSPLAEQADELVVVLQPSPASITSAYAGLKRLHYAHARQQFRLLVNGVAGAAEAEKIIANLAGAGTRYLGISVSPAGWVRADAHLAPARRLNQTVTEAYPASAASVDFRRIAVAMGQWPCRPAPGAPRTASPLRSDFTPPGARETRQPETTMA